MRRIALDAFCRLVGDLAERAMYESAEHAEELTERVESLGFSVDLDTQEDMLWEMQRLALFALVDACAEFFQRQDTDLSEGMRVVSDALLERYVQVLATLEVQSDEIAEGRIETWARIAEYDQALRAKSSEGPPAQFSRVAARHFFGLSLGKKICDSLGEELVVGLNVYPLYGKQLKEFRRKFQSLALARTTAA